MVFETAVPEPDLAWHLPEPATLWIDASPREMPHREALLLDPRTRDLAGIGRRPVLARARPAHGPTTVYLSATRSGESEAERVEEWCRASDIVALRHVQPGAISTDPGPMLIDGLVAAIEGRWDRLAEASGDAVVLWPLLSGVGDSEEALTVGLDAVAAAAPRAVVGFVPELSTASRRHLSERYGEALFDALFHPAPPAPRRFAAACRERDLEFLPPRFVDRGVRRLERTIAAELGLVAELLGALDAPPQVAQDFYRAARWAEATPHDIGGLVAEGNLGVVPALDDRIERVIVELAEGAGRSAELSRLVDRWAGQERAD